MFTWQSEYLIALQLRDRCEKTNRILCEQYRRLADRAATLENATVLASRFQAAQFGSGDDRSLAASSLPATRDGLAKMRNHLSEAQRARNILRHELQSTSVELQRHKIDSELVSRQLRDLDKEKAILSIGLKDRNEELRAKSKLLEEVHNETVSLTLQLNMADERSKRLERENKELVHRWMERMGQEADAMNDTSKYS